MGERLAGAKWALELIDWRGIGVGEYRIVLRDFLNENEIHYEPWQIDYVHSVPLLVTVELGLVITMLLAGGLLLLLKVFYADRWWWLMPILPLILFDHYVLTQMAPLALVLTVLVLLHGMPARVVH